MLKTVLCTLVTVFLLTVSQFLIPFVRDIFRGSLLFLLPPLILLLLGIILIIITLKTKVKGKLKKFLLLTGWSAVGILTSIFLHNMVYGLLITIFGPDFWGGNGTGDEALFFILALFIFPVTFIVGAIGSSILLCKRKSQKKT